MCVCIASLHQMLCFAVYESTEIYPHEIPAAQLLQACCTSEGANEGCFPISHSRRSMIHPGYPRTPDSVSYSFSINVTSPHAGGVAAPEHQGAILPPSTTKPHCALRDIDRSRTEPWLNLSFPTVAPSFTQFHLKLLWPDTAKVKD